MSSNEEIREQEYKEACDKLTEEITAAIGRSISHDETVDVQVDESILDMNDALQIIGNLADTFDEVWNRDGTVDIYGTHEGDEFRLNLDYC